FLDAVQRRAEDARARAEAARRREQEQRQQARRRRAFTGVGLAVLLLVSVSAGVALWQWRSARHAQAAAEQARPAAAAVGMLTQADPARVRAPPPALHRGAAPYPPHPGPEPPASLAATLTNSHYTGTLTGHAGAVYSVVFASDGHTLATGGADNTVILW